MIFLHCDCFNIAIDTTTTEVGVTLSPIFGYRLQPKAGGFSFRAGLSRVIGGIGSGVVVGGFVPLPYVSFGAAF